MVLGSVVDVDDHLLSLDGHTGRAPLAVGLFLVTATSACATALLLFLILSRHAEGLAAGYTGLRAFENVFYVAGTMGLLVMLTVSQSEALGSATRPTSPSWGRR